MNPVRSAEKSRVSSCQFAEEVARLGEFEVLTDKGYEQPARTPIVGGVLDRRWRF